MLNLELYKKLVEQWEAAVGPGTYQVLPSKKFDACTKYISVLQGTRVIDIGSNAGVITYDLAQRAMEWRGVEHYKKFHKQALITAKYIETPGEFVLSGITDFLLTTDFDYNALYASCVLYHLSPRDIEVIRDVALPRCDVVLFLSREDERKRHKNDLYQWKAIDEFLRQAGMVTEVRNKESNWVSLIGRRPQ